VKTAIDTNAVVISNYDHDGKSGGCTPGSQALGASVPGPYYLWSEPGPKYAWADGV
jgi:hypothetical protein